MYWSRFKVDDRWPVRYCGADNDSCASQSKDRDLGKGFIEAVAQAHAILNEFSVKLRLAELR